MSVQNVEKFYKLLTEDKSLMEKVTKAGEEFKNQIETRNDPDKSEMAGLWAVLDPIAREADCPFTLEDLEEYGKGERTLTDDELDAMAGGNFCLFTGTLNSKVACTWNGRTVHFGEDNKKYVMICSFYVGLDLEKTW